MWTVRRALRERQQDELDRDLILAWNVVRVELMSMKRDGARELPSLKKLLTKKDEPQSFEEQKAVFYQIAARLGAKVTTIPRKAHGSHP